MITEVGFMSRPLAMTTGPWGKAGIISITSEKSDRVRLMKGWRRVLRLHFHDIERPEPGRIAFDESHADAILDWLEKVEGRLETIHVHCNAGKHRSAAVAMFIVERYDVSGFDRNYPLYNKRVYRVLTRRWRARQRSAKPT